MKRLIIVFFALVLTTLIADPLPAHAGSAPSTMKIEQSPTLKPEDVKRLREAAEAINDLLQTMKPKSEIHAKPGKQEEPEKKNMGDVADRALSILSNYISSA